MTMPPGLRKLMLAIHLTVSVGWLGAVMAYLALDLTVASSQEPQIVRAAWLAMDLVVSLAIVPLALAALVTGLVMSLGTKWGLFRHWWVLISFVLTSVATLVLLSEAGVVRRTAEIAADPTTSAEGLLALQPTLVHSAGGLVVLLLVQVLNVYKPQGLTPYGWRKQQEERRRRQRQAATAP
jgi:acid phosphatase family membrane protein YuiD